MTGIASRSADRRGPDSDPEESDPLSRYQPWLAGLYAASVSGRVAFGPNAGRRVTRTGDQIDPESVDALASPRCASVSGFSLHANVAVHAGDRQRLERLARYCARPPIAMERLEPLADGRMLYRFKRPWRDGTTHIVLPPLEMLEKLAALVPAPKTHLVRYSGILAPAAKWRSQIVPNESVLESALAMDPPCVAETPSCAKESLAAVAVGAPAEPSPKASPTARHPRNYPWSELMKRVFELDVLECVRCGARLRILAPSPQMATLNSRPF